MIQQMSKAYVARAIWDESGYIKTLNEWDPMIFQALKAMTHAQELLKN